MVHTSSQLSTTQTEENNTDSWLPGFQSNLSERWV